MLPILLCEDVPEELKSIARVIRNYVLIEELDMKVVCATNDPDVILEYVRRNRRQSLYFLDLELSHEMNGFTLAQRIREYDPRGFIVMVTTHSEMSPLAFEYKIEALDYIVKDDRHGFESKLISCLIHAYARYSIPERGVQKVAAFRISGKLFTFLLDEIYSVESSDEHRGVRIYQKNTYTDAAFPLVDAEKKLDEMFYRCHKSCIVNLSHIRLIDKQNYLVKLDNGQECPVSVRKYMGLKRAFNRYLDGTNDKIKSKDNRTKEYSR